MLNLLLFGPPGSGKGTQAHFLSSRYGIAHISTGDMLRDQVRQGTQLGRRAAEFMNRGDYVPDEVMIGMIRSRIQDPDCSNGWILDGFPRTVPQAKALDEMLASEKETIHRLLYLQVDVEEIVARLTQRWTCPDCSRTYHMKNHPPRDDKRCDEDGTELIRREDDNPEVARNRTKVYYERTYPILDYYRPRGIVVEVDGEGAVAAVRRRIEDALPAPETLTI